MVSIGACDRAAQSPVAPTAIAPTINSVSPAALTASDRPQTLTLRASDFLPGVSIVVEAPSGRSTTLSGSLIQPLAEGFEISVTLASPGEYWLIASNAPGAPSARYRLTVAARPTPWISGVAPAPLAPAADPQTITVTGSGFAPGIIVTLVSGVDVTIIGDNSIGQVTNTSFTLRHVFRTSGTYAMNLVTAAGDPSNTITVVVR